MACPHPLQVSPSYRVGSHYYTSPYTYDVPCGYCVCCRKDLQNYWIDRAEYEYCNKLTASFVTFTYDDIHLVDRCAVSNPDGSLIFDNGQLRASVNQHDLTCFIQNIRKYIINHPEIQNILCQPNFSYLYCLEYGDIFNRPHAHVLFFGLDFAYCKKIIFEQWKYGFIDVLPLLDGGIRYVCKYMDKFEKGHLAWLKYDVKGLARPCLRASQGFGQGLLWDNAQDIVDNFYTYKVSNNKRRPISAYWKFLLTGCCVSRDVTKKSFFEKHPVYLAISKLNRANQMKEYNLHRIKDIYNDDVQREFRISQAKKRESRILSQLHIQHIPVFDYDEIVKSCYGFITYDGKKIRRLPSVSQRLLADEYRFSLEQKWLEDKFPLSTGGIKWKVQKIST